MARIKHIALVTDDPAKTAEFYKQHFGLTELYRRPTDTGEKGVWLSDGYIYFAILKYGTEDAPKLGPGQSSELRGIHHIGFHVDHLAVDRDSADAFGERLVVGSDDTACMVDLGGARPELLVEDRDLGRVNDTGAQKADAARAAHCLAKAVEVVKFGDRADKTE